MIVRLKGEVCSGRDCRILLPRREGEGEVEKRPSNANEPRVEGRGRFDGSKASRPNSPGCGGWV